MTLIEKKQGNTGLQRFILVIVSLFVCSNLLFAQNKTKSNGKIIDGEKSKNASPDAQTKTTFKGTVVDEKGNPLPKVSIFIKGSAKATLSDEQGKFSIQVESNSFVVFSFVGYVDKEVNVSTQKNATISMQSSNKLLDDVVIIGYGTRKKKEVTGAVAQVKGEDLEKTSASDIGTAIQGRVSGVNVQASSGAPGDDANILIRGVGSIQGSNSPLYIVDGIPYDSDPKLSPNEIASLDILKDAASAAVYGSRGANGVIIITTKQGKAGEMKISLNSYYGIQKITSRIPLMGLEDFLYQASIRNMNTGTAANKDLVYLPVNTNPTLLLNNTDWLGELQIDKAGILNHSIQLSGGTQNLQYNFSGSYFNQDGVLINSGYNRYNSRANATFIKDKWNVQTSLAFSTDSKRIPPSGLVYRAIALAPYAKSLKNASNFTSASGEDIPVGLAPGDIATLSAQVNSLKAYNISAADIITGNIKVAYNFTKRLSFSSLLGIVYNNNRNTQFSPVFYTKSFGSATPVIGAPLSSLTYTSTRNINIINENVLNYSFDVGDDNHFTLTSLYSAQEITNNVFSAYRNGLISNDLTVLDAATGTQVVTGNRSDRTLLSLLGRIQYNFKSRYLFSAGLRRDGSSRFSASNRYAIFPQVSAGWNISDEKFWMPLGKTFNSFKLRASYGQTGSQNFGDYTTVPVLTNNIDYVFGRESSDLLSVGTTQTAFSNQAAKWETSITRNFGFDLGILNSIVTLTVDYYFTDKKDMLFPLLLPLSAGGGSTTLTKNIGNMTNNGVEVSASYRYTHRNFKMNVTANFGANKNVATYVPSTLYLTSGAPVNGNDYVTVVKQGYEVGAYFLIPTSGIIRTTSQLTEYVKATGKTGARLGDLMYKDVNKDGKISDDDRVYMGSGAPKYDLGLNFNFSYKEFDLSMLWYASVGNKAINGTKIYAYQQGSHRDLLYQYSSANLNSTVPTNRGGSADNDRAYSDYWVEEASFIRLRQVSLGYTLPNKISNLLRMSLFKVFVSAQNPITITRYTGFDPEVGGDGVGSRGIDKGTYPVSSQYKVGLQINF